MKTAQQIIGLPVVSIFDGNEIGKVKNLIINASKGTIDFFVIDSGIRSLAGGVIPADRVLGIGEYALTIEQPDDISDIVKIPAAIELMQKNITVRGTRVLTRKGSLLGETGDIYIDEESYNIIGVEFIPEADIKSGIIPRKSIITFGKNLLVVQDDFIDQLIESPSAIDPVIDTEKKNNVVNDIDTVTAAEQPQTIDMSVDTTIDTSIDVSDALSDIDELYRIDGFEPDTKKEENLDSELNILDQQVQQSQSVQEKEPSHAAAIFEQRQRQYLVGKKVTKSIYDSSGRLIVGEGEIITEQIIKDVKAHDRLIELVMNYEE
jgi:uncharacterized protein YrrD